MAENWTDNLNLSGLASAAIETGESADIIGARILDLVTAAGRADVDGFILLVRKPKHVAGEGKTIAVVMPSMTQGEADKLKELIEQK